MNRLSALILIIFTCKTINGDVPDANALSNIRSDALVEHNNFRQKHSSPNLVFDDALNDRAQKYAVKLTEIGSLVHSGSGENLFVSCGYPSVNITTIGKEATESWYNEIKNYDFNTQGSINGDGIGHFTQLVWKESTKVGFGVAIFDKLDQESNINWKCVYFVAQYSPAGNVIDTSENNVNPKILYINNVLPAAIQHQ